MMGGGMMGGGGPGMRMPMGPRFDEQITRQQVKPGTVRRILPYAKPYRWALALLLFVTALDATITVATPLILGLVIDFGIQGRHVRDLVVLSVIMAAMGVLDAIANYLQSWTSARIG